MNPLRSIAFTVVEGRKGRVTRLRPEQPGERRPTTRGSIHTNISGNRPEETTSTSATAGLTIGEHYMMSLESRRLMEPFDQDSPIPSVKKRAMLPMDWRMSKRIQAANALRPIRTAPPRLAGSGARCDLWQASQ